MRSMVEGLIVAGCPSTGLQPVPLPMRFARREDLILPQRGHAEEQLQERQRRGEPERGKTGLSDHSSVSVLCLPSGAAWGGM